MSATTRHSLSRPALPQCSCSSTPSTPDWRASAWFVLLGWVGTFSYSLYLTHMLPLGVMLQVCRPLLGTPSRFLVVYFMEIIAAVAIAYPFFYLFERPFLKPPGRDPCAAGDPGAGGQDRPAGTGQSTVRGPGGNLTTNISNAPIEIAMGDQSSLPTADAPPSDQAQAAAVRTAAAASPPLRPHLTIQPTSGWAAINVRELWQFRDLLMSLAQRDVKLRYKQTALGVIWVVLQPLLAAGIFSFVFGKVAKLPSDGLPYFLFSYAGLLGWNLFNNTLSKCSTCLVGNSQLISKVFFPRLVLPLSTVPSSLIDFGVALAMMAVLMVFYRVPPTWAILLLPLWMAVLILLSLGIGLCTAALTVSYRDVQYILPVFLQILLYASPIAYALSAVPAHLRSVYLLNPLSGPPGSLPLVFARHTAAAHGLARLRHPRLRPDLLHRRL